MQVIEARKVRGGHQLGAGVRSGRVQARGVGVRCRVGFFWGRGTACEDSLYPVLQRLAALLVVAQHGPPRFCKLEW